MGYDTRARGVVKDSARQLTEVTLFEVSTDAVSDE